LACIYIFYCEKWSGSIDANAQDFIEPLQFILMNLRLWKLSEFRLSKPGEMGMNKRVLTALMGSAVGMTVLAGAANAATFSYNGTLQSANGTNAVASGTAVTGSFTQGTGSSEASFLRGLLTQAFGTSLTASDLAAGTLSGSSQFNSSAGTTNVQFSNGGFSLDNQGQAIFDQCAAGTATGCSFSTLNLTFQKAGGGSFQAQIQNGALAIGGGSGGGTGGGGTGGGGTGGGGTGGGSTQIPEPGVVLALGLGAAALLGQRRQSRI
jgi:hypothetical protein